jgi:hypothetical protein
VPNLACSSLSEGDGQPCDTAPYCKTRFERKGRAFMSAKGLGCVKTRRRGKPIDWNFRQIAISAVRILKHAQSFYFGDNFP